MQYLGGSGLPRTVLSIATVPWSSEMPAPLAIRARKSRGVPCVDCVCLLILARWLRSVGGGACSLPSGMQQEDYLTDCIHGLRQCKMRVPCLCVCVVFRLGIGEYHDCSCLPAPTRRQGSIELTLGWERDNAVTAHTHQSQSVSGGVLQLPKLADFSL